MKKLRLLLVALAMTMLLSGCGVFDSSVNSLKGSLIGVSYTANFYDNFGSRFLTVSGTNIDIDGNVIKETRLRQ